MSDTPKRYAARTVIRSQKRVLQLAIDLDQIARDLFAELCEGEGQHSEELDLALIRKHLRRALAAPPATGWQPIATAPKDGTLFLAYAPGRDGLSEMQSLCAWHPDAGFCIDELRCATHWQPLPAPPTQER